jgi:hypothetical protein
MRSLNENISGLRYLSQLFSAPSFKKIIRDDDKMPFKRRLKKHFPDAPSNIKYKKIFEHLYSELQSNYRSEYLFKNALLNKLLIEKHGLKTTTVLNEFAVGGSIADFVLLNGESRIYEIKTDLDSLDKLKKQVSDYIQFANKVYIVTSPKHTEKLLLDYAETSIGIIEFTSSNCLKELKIASDNSKAFNFITLFKTLRKQEYLEILNSHFGYIPQVPNTILFKECFELAKKIDLHVFQKLVYSKLKERKIQCPDLLKSDSTPYELKHICYTLDLTMVEYSKFYKFINTTT